MISYARTQTQHYQIYLVTHITNWDHHTHDGVYGSMLFNKLPINYVHRGLFRCFMLIITIIINDTAFDFDRSSGSCYDKKKIEN